MDEGRCFFKQSSDACSCARNFVLFIYPFCVENGACDWFRLWITAGIPFGTAKVHLWIVPKELDIDGMAGAAALSLLIGGIIGAAVLAWKLIVAAVYIAKSVVLGGLWTAGTLSALRKKLSGSPANKCQ